MLIGLFADPHSCCKAETCITRRPSLSAGKISDALSFFRGKGVDLVICLGDLTDDNGSHSEDINALKRLTGDINSFGIPFYSLMGNHDFQSFTAEEFNGITAALPPFSIETDCGTLVFLDANHTAQGPYIPGNVDWTDTVVPEEQLRELKKLLNESVQKPVYIFLHQCLDTNVEEHHIVHNADVIRNMLESSPRKITVFEGHYHPGKESMVNGIEYHTLPAMCEGTGNRYALLTICEDGQLEYKLFEA